MHYESVCRLLSAGWPGEVYVLIGMVIWSYMDIIHVVCVCCVCLCVCVCVCVRARARALVRVLELHRLVHFFF